MSWKFFGTTFFVKKVVKKSNGASFLGLSQALGMMAGGLAMWGGAKLDELTNNQLGKSKSSSEKDLSDYIIDKAKSNVGLPTLNEVKSSGKQLGVNYSKGYRKPNMKRAEDMFDRLDKKRRGGLGARTGKATATFIQGMTGDLTNRELLETLWNNTGSLFVASESVPKDIHGSYPYNVINYERQRDEARKLIIESWRSLWGQLGEVKLSSEGGSMSEGARSNAYNNMNDRIKSGDSGNFEKPFSSKSMNINDYMEELNRNVTQRISEPYLSSDGIELMIKNSIKEYNNLK